MSEVSAEACATVFSGFFSLLSMTNVMPPVTAGYRYDADSVEMAAKNSKN